MKRCFVECVRSVIVALLFVGVVSVLGGAIGVTFIPKRYGVESASLLIIGSMIGAFTAINAWFILVAIDNRTMRYTGLRQLTKWVITAPKGNGGWYGGGAV